VKIAASPRYNPRVASDVIVIGGGIVGLSAARALAAAGARVVVVERGTVGGEASGAAAGMVAPQAEAAFGSPLLPLALAARDRHLVLAAELEAETGIAVDLSPRGMLEVALTAEDEERLAERFRWQRAAGLPVETLGAADLREAEPNLSAAVRGALFLPGDRRVDNVRLTRALAASATARGARLLCGRPVQSLCVEGGRVTGVEAGGERLRGDCVVNAAGAWAGTLEGDPAPPPVVPVRGHLVAFDLVPAMLRHVVASPRGYLVPHALGRTLAGSTTEHAGFDKSVTARALHAVLAIALELVPALADAPVADAWAGLRPGTPDGLPVIGPGALPGLVHAGGLFRNGILLGPLVGEIAADLALGVAARFAIGAFAPARFGEGHRAALVS
jgi:glycine oxidase